jgi:predicted ATPase
MKILRYKLASVGKEEWSFDEVNFDRVNLLVGDSATGKTRFLNTVIHFMQQIVAEKMIFSGDWDTDFEIEGQNYQYKLLIKSSKTMESEKEVLHEELINKTSGISLLKRNDDTFTWKEKELPRLSRNISAISLLKNENELKPIYSNLRRVVARRFFGDELNQNFQIGALSPDKIKRIINAKDAQNLLNEKIDFHNKMNLLNLLDPVMYAQICALYKTAFPYILECSIQPFSKLFPGLPLPLQAPVFCIRERKVDAWIPVNDISSGMQKLFLLILDVFLMKDSGILLIDEYENSLGVNAINFLPDLIHNISDKCQFIITSHHPYIINTIPIENWYVFHRDGLEVRIKTGKELKEKYKHSKQEQFVQLLNDPFYTGGVE